MNGEVGWSILRSALKYEKSYLYLFALEKQ